jgi:hypothetical protein
MDPNRCTAGNACIEGTCQPARPAGDPCTVYTDCERGLYCDFYATSAQCRAPRAAGEACAKVLAECEPGLDCESGVCTSRGDRSGGTGNPVMRPLRRAGEHCEDSGICPLGTTCRCDDLPACETMSCVSGPALGESCEPQEFRRETPDGTISGVAGDAFDAYRCSKGICDMLSSMRCVEPRGPGAPCSFAEPSVTFECISMICKDHRCMGYDERICQAASDAG